jgi:quercetin dioxygenase-like cupin family protein
MEEQSTAIKSRSISYFAPPKSSEETMSNPLKAIAVLVLGASLTTPATQELNAQQQSPSPNAVQTIKRTPLRKVDVPGANYEVVFVMVEIPSNTKVGRHSHPGTVFAYLLEGDYKLLMDGQAAKEYKTGETFEIAAGLVHDEQVGAKAAKALVVFTVEKGKPLASPAQ